MAMGKAPPQRRTDLDSARIALDMLEQDGVEEAFKWEAPSVHSEGLEQTFGEVETEAPLLHGSADRPLTFEGREFAMMKAGRQRRLLGSVVALQRAWMFEQSIYTNIGHSNRKLRRRKVDLVEIYVGLANVTSRTLECGFRALQPIDQLRGAKLKTRADHSSF